MTTSTTISYNINWQVRQLAKAYLNSGIKVSLLN